MVFYYSNRKVTGVSQDLSGEGGGQYWGKKEEDIYISYFSVTVIKHYDFIEGSVIWTSSLFFSDKFLRGRVGEEIIKKIRKLWPGLRWKLIPSKFIKKYTIFYIVFREKNGTNSQEANQAMLHKRFLSPSPNQEHNDTILIRRKIPVPWAETLTSWRPWLQLHPQPCQVCFCARTLM